jgi:putative two-component system response regulator
MNTDNLAETPRGRILVVDDDPFNLKILGRLLQPHHDVFAALSGVDALRIAACAPQPDLILLDVMMPDMNGFDVIIRLRDNSATRDIPVIFATGLDSTEDEERGLELGAVDYITKPYRPLIILARIRTQLELKRTRERLANLETELAKRINLT